jgi:hypothetical protein
LNPVINEKSEMFKGMNNKNMGLNNKKRQQKLTKEKRVIA